MKNHLNYIFILYFLLAACPLAAQNSSMEDPFKMVANSVQPNMNQLYSSDHLQISIRHSYVTHLGFVAQSDSLIKSEPKYILNGVLIGSLTGAFIGGIIGNTSYKPCKSDYAFGCFLDSKEFNTLAGASVGFISGAIVGGIWGAVVKGSKKERVHISYKPVYFEKFDQNPGYGHSFKLKYSFN